MILSVHLDERTRSILLDAAHRTGRTVEDLAEAAIANAALEYFSLQQRSSQRFNLFRKPT